MECISVNQQAFDGPFPYFSRPESIGEYTVDRERKIHLGRGEAKYLYESVVGSSGLQYDLNIGNESFEEKGDEKLDVLLEWIKRQSEDGSNLKKALHEADFVCWRGLLTRIAATPYSNRDDWMFVANRVKGVTFLCELKTDEQLRRKAEMTSRDKLMTYWGFKFEQYMTVEEKESQPNTSTPVCTKEEFAVVVKSSLVGANPSKRKEYKLVYSGEVDALDKDGNLVEMKTQRRSLDGGFWRHKSMKWWLQSFLIGIRKIVVGFRDDAGFVNKVDSVKLEELTKGQWGGNVCMNFLSTVLSKVDTYISQNESSCCLVKFNPASNKVVIEAASNGEQNFLSDSFRRHFSIE